MARKDVVIFCVVLDFDVSMFYEILCDISVNKQILDGIGKKTYFIIVLLLVYKTDDGRI